MRKHTFPLRDINGNGPVRSLYNVPVCLSANEAKQKMLALDDASSLIIFVNDGRSIGCKILLELLALDAKMTLALPGTVGMVGCDGGTP